MTRMPPELPRPDGDQLATLLHVHIGYAAAFVSAAKTGDAAQLATAKTAWCANADQIATLVGAKHTDPTLAQTTARLTAGCSNDMADPDVVVSHVVLMFAALSVGIAEQFATPLDGLGRSAHHTHSSARGRPRSLLDGHSTASRHE
jgi:hypothetical protein